MSELASTQFSDGFIVLCGMGLGLVSILGTIFVGATLISAHYRRRAQLDDMEATLKMEMIQRGMSAEDVERVLAARMGQSDSQMLVKLMTNAAARKPRGWSQPAQQT